MDNNRNPENFGGKNVDYHSEIGTFGTYAAMSELIEHAGVYSWVAVSTSWAYTPQTLGPLMQGAAGNHSSAQQRKCVFRLRICCSHSHQHKLLDPGLEAQRLFE